jgi:hypothetical protein
MHFKYFIWGMKMLGEVMNKLTRVPVSLFVGWIRMWSVLNGRIRIRSNMDRIRHHRAWIYELV